MIGTIVNVAGILIGGMIGLARRKPLSSTTESFFRVMLGALTVYFGLQLSWMSFNGSFLPIAKQITIAVLALILGKLSGRLFGSRCRLVRFSGIGWLCSGPLNISQNCSRECAMVG